MSLPRYPEYKDSGIAWLGEVPGHWNVAPLKRGYQVVLGKMLQNDASGPDDELVPYLRAANIKWKGVDVSDIKQMWVSQREMKQLALSAEDLLISEGGDVGRSAIWQNELDPCYFQNSVNRARAHEGNSTRFLYYWISTIKDNGFIDIICNKSTIAHFTAEKVAAVPVPFPTQEEQQSIATFLDRETRKIDALIAEQQRLVELLAEKRQAVISHAVTKGLNPNVRMKDSGIEWLGDVPVHWSVGTLTRIAERVVVGIAEAATHAYVEIGTPILRATNIRPGKIIGELLYLDSNFADDRGSKLLNAGDLVTVRTGNAGVTAVVPKELDGCQCFTMLITTLISAAAADFYCYWMNSVAAKCYFSLEGWGTAQINISVPILKCLPAPIPTFEEQQKIVAFLDAETAKFDTLTTEASRAIELLQERRCALISAAVTGKIDVRSISTIKEAA